MYVKEEQMKAQSQEEEQKLSAVRRRSNTDDQIPTDRSAAIDKAAKEENDMDMQENEIEEFCETSSWETLSGEDEYYDLDKDNKSKRKKSEGSQRNDTIRTESDEDSDQISQNDWEHREETSYKKEKIAWREHLQKQTMIRQEMAQSDNALASVQQEKYEQNLAALDEISSDEDEY